jgi:hypothetical protein
MQTDSVVWNGAYLPGSALHKSGPQQFHTTSVVTASFARKVRSALVAAACDGRWGEGEAGGYEPFQSRRSHSKWSLRILDCGLRQLRMAAVPREHRVNAKAAAVGADSHGLVRPAPRVRTMHHKRVVVTRYGGPEVIAVIEEDIPTPKAGEVRVKVLAAGVGLPDVLEIDVIRADTGGDRESEIAGFANSLRCQIGGPERL